jgi:hypothetical protein
VTDEIIETEVDEQIRDEVTETGKQAKITIKQP